MKRFNILATGAYRVTAAVAAVAVIATAWLAATRTAQTPSPVLRVSMELPEGLDWAETAGAGGFRRQRRRYRSPERL